MKRIKRILLVLVGLYLALALLVYFGQEFMLFHPITLPEDHVLQIDQEFKELEIPVDEEVDLNAALFECPNPKGLILFYHGNGGSVEHCSPAMKRFTALGWNALLVDYRAYGKSDGELEPEAFLSDALTCYDYAKDSLGYENIIVYGESIGTGLATYVASEREPTKLILEAPYYSMVRIAENRFPFLPTDLILKYPLRSNEYIERSNCPILAFHGTDDNTIPIKEHAMALKSEFPHIDLVILEGGGHVGFGGYPEYQAALKAFLAN